MHEHVERGQDEHDDAADRMRPRRPLGAHEPVAQKIDHADEGGEICRDDADGHQPSGKIRPHHICGLPIGQVGQKAADEADDRDRHEHGMDGMSGDPHRRTGVGDRQRNASMSGSDTVTPETIGRPKGSLNVARWQVGIGLAARAPPVSVTILVSAATAGFQAYRPALRGDLQRHDIDMRVEGASSPMAKWASERQKSQPGSRS